jgi:heme o synthase
MSVTTTPTQNTVRVPAGLLAWIPIYLELGKARLNSFVVFTAGVGYMAALPVAEWNPLTLCWLVIGTALSACGANGLNQVVEAKRDARMERTRNRPLPSGRITVSHALTASLAGVVLGSLLLTVTTNALTGALALFTALLYVLVYTPLKTRTIFNTAVGAVCGAIPPVMGWTAATGTFGAGGWILGAILFAWQMPHFLALAWMYRDDYDRGGYRMLPQRDGGGTLTCLATILHAASLVPIALLGTVFGLGGWIYSAGAVALGAFLVLRSIELYRRRTREAARSVFLASLVYLPVLLGLLIASRWGLP